MSSLAQCDWPVIHTLDTLSPCIMPICVHRHWLAAMLAFTEHYQDHGRPSFNMARLLLLFSSDSHLQSDAASGTFRIIVCLLLWFNSYLFVQSSRRRLAARGQYALDLDWRMCAHHSNCPATGEANLHLIEWIASGPTWCIRQYANGTKWAGPLEYYAGPVADGSHRLRGNLWHVARVLLVGLFCEGF